MGKFYRISLNCARVRQISTISNDCGFINILPLKGTKIKKGLLGSKYIPVIEYEGHFSVIAEQIDDYLEDVVLKRKIYYDPNGLRDVTKASFEELMDNLKHGLTCYNMIEIQPELAIYYKNIIESDLNILNKYNDELSSIARKELVINELVYRLDMQNQSENIKNVKKRILNSKSA